MAAWVCDLWELVVAFIWELRQSVEGYLGFVLQSILTGAYPVTVLTLRSALLAVGIEVQSGDHDRVKLTNLDHHQEKGVKLTI